MAIKVKNNPDAPVIQSKATFIQHVIKGDTYTVLSASSFQPEDEFTGLYFTTKDPSKVFLQPPFDLKYLKAIPHQNNILAQCIEAMEVNIDGTGYELVPKDPDKEKDEAEEKRIKSFLDEPYPGQSLTSIRRDLRQDMEAVGWGALELLRNVVGDLVGFRHVQVQTIRFLRLDNPVQVTKKLTRDGKEVDLTYWTRERRFAQVLGHGQYRYFKEYGATRHLRAMGTVHIGNPLQVEPATTPASAGTGKGGVKGSVAGDWESETNKIEPMDRGTELLIFKVQSDPNSPYGVPRWINQLPSTLGSRKAEEQNLEFFDSGGMPPAIIFIEGGTLAKDTADQLRMYLSGQMKARNRAVVVEAQSSSGSLDSTGQVRTKVERFGAESSKDAMYANYDKNCEEHVRTGFRLPPLFIGKAADYSYASASTSYMVAEAQVFGPERFEFDEVFNRTIMRELKAETCVFKSKPITLKDVTSQLKGLELSKDVSKKEEWISEVNKITDLSLQFDKEAADQAMAAKETGQEAAQIGVARAKAEAKAVGAKFVDKDGDGKPDKPEPEETKEEVQKDDGMPRSPKTILRLTNRFLVTEGLVQSRYEPDENERAMVRKSVDTLSKDERDLFNRFLAARIQQVAEHEE